MKNRTNTDSLRQSECVAVPVTLRNQFEAALRSDFDRLLWLQDLLLSRGEDSRSALRKALVEAYQTLSRYHAA